MARIYLGSDQQAPVVASELLLVRRLELPPDCQPPAQNPLIRQHLPSHRNGQVTDVFVRW